jgi:hypothetical protein
MRKPYLIISEYHNKIGYFGSDAITTAATYHNDDDVCDHDHIATYQ